MSITIATLRQAGLTDAQILAVLEVEQTERIERGRANAKAYRARVAARAASSKSYDANDANDANDARARAHEESSLLKDLEVKKEEVSLARTCEPTSARGTRLPQSWEPSEAGRVFALDRLGSPAAVQDQLAAFRDYWQAHAGATARKRDWEAAWRNWCRKARPSKYVMLPKDRQLQESFDVRDALKAYVAAHEHDRRDPPDGPSDGVLPFRFSRSG